MARDTGGEDLSRLFWHEWFEGGPRPGKYKIRKKELSCTHRERRERNEEEKQKQKQNKKTKQKTKQKRKKKIRITDQARRNGFKKKKGKSLSQRFFSSFFDSFYKEYIECTRKKKKKKKVKT